MFPNLWHISNDEDSFNDDDDELIESKKGIIDINGITITNDSEILIDDVEGSNEIPSLNVPMERALVHLCFLMQNVINECKQEGTTLCDHATSHLWVLESNIWNICLTKAKESLHPKLVLQCVENG